MKRNGFIVLLVFIVSLCHVNAQLHDSLNFKIQQTDTIAPLRFSYRQLYLPEALAASGIAAYFNAGGIKNDIVKFRNNHLPSFKTSVDTYLQFSPFVIAYGLDALGVQSKTDFMDRSAIMLKGEAMMLGAVYILKSSVKELRPDGSAYNSFPSGHTAQAFAAATLLSEEYKDRFKWMPYAAYTLASSVGVLRMANNRHYIGDVLVGAGIGILSMKVAYWTDHYKFRKTKVIYNPSDF